MVSNSRKKAPKKSILFPLDRKLVSTGRDEGFVEKYVFTRCKKLLLVAVFTSQKLKDSYANYIITNT